MLLLDGVAQARWQRWFSVERTRQITRDALVRLLEYEKREFADDISRPVTSLEAQTGSPLMHTEFERRLRRLNPKLIYEQSISFPDRGGIYRIAPDGTKVFICGCGHGWMPEFTVRKFKEDLAPHPTERGVMIPVKIPDEPVMGWRTVLARLLRGGFVSTNLVNEFPSVRNQSRRWHELTH
jgi:hypothetical protein